MLRRVTTLVYQEGDVDYIVEDSEQGDEIGEWIQPRPWCGQTVFTFPAAPLPSPDRRPLHNGARNQRGSALPHILVLLTS